MVQQIIMTTICRILKRKKNVPYVFVIKITKHNLYFLFTINLESRALFIILYPLKIENVCTFILQTGHSTGLPPRVNIQVHAL
jgi:hypothetical protein